MTIESFYRSSKTKFLRKILPIVKDADLAEDLVQEAVIKAVEKYHLYDVKKASEETWFKYILFSTVWDWKRSQKRQLSIVEADLEELLDESTLDKDCADISEIIEISNPLHAKIFHLKYVLGYTNQEISSLLNINELNVKKILQRLKKQI